MQELDLADKKVVKTKNNELSLHAYKKVLDRIYINL